MSKSSSMPAKPAPPIPRNAAAISESHNSPKREENQSQEDLTHDTQNHLSSLESIPSLKLDLSDLIAETGKRFNSSLHTKEGDYLEPHALHSDRSEATQYPIRFAVNQLYHEPIINETK